MHSGLGHLLTRSKEAAFLTHICSSNEVFGGHENRQENRVSSWAPNTPLLAFELTENSEYSHLSYILGSF